MGIIENELMYLKYLDWTRSRHSSGTAGSFLKSYEEIKGQKLYYKISNYNSQNGIIGHECVNEIVVDRLLSNLRIEHLSYDLVHAEVYINGREHETYLSRSRDFKNKGESKITLELLYKHEGLENESPLEFCKRMGWDDYIYNMLVTDYLIMNRDRHGANIEILKNRKNRQIYPAPLFDHGLSLLFNCRSDIEYEAIDPLVEKRVQCYVGGNDTYENLLLIPSEKMLQLPEFDSNLKTELFEGLENIMGNKWVEAVWNFLQKRAEKYEILRIERQSTR